MTAKTSGGQIYAETLGYTVTNGEVDYTALTLENLSGPYVAENSSTSSALPACNSLPKRRNFLFLRTESVRCLLL